MTMRPLFVSALLVACLHAQTRIDSSGLVSGYLFDAPSRSLRAILGVPGSAHLGPAALSGLDHALAAPGGGWAVALRAGQTVIVQLSAGTVSREWMPSEVLTTYTAVSWAADGKSAALYDAASKSLQRIEAGSTAVTILETATLDIEGTVKSIAASRDGSQVAIITATEAAMKLYIAAGGTARAVFESTRLGAVAPAGDNFFAVDEAGGMLIEAGASAAPAWPVPEAVSALLVPAGGKLLYAAAKESPRIVVYDIASRTQLREIATDLPAASLLALSRDTLVLLNARRRKGEALFVLDTQNDPAVYFVPAGDE